MSTGANGIPKKKKMPSVSGEACYNLAHVKVNQLQLKAIKKCSRL